MALNPSDSYWIIADDTDHVWGSASRTLVSVTDPTYVAWTETDGNFTRRISSYSDLYGSLLVNAPAIAAQVGFAWAEAELLDPLSSFTVLSQAGCEIHSTGHPEINATYSTSPQALFNMVAVIVGIVAGKGFPSGASTFKFTTLTGQVTFATTDLFVDAGVAVRDYVASLNQTYETLVGGGTASWPSLPVVIA